MISRQLLKIVSVIIISLVWGLSCAYSSTLEVPSFVVSVPKEHFAGVSEPSRSIAEARKSAINDIVRQILASVSVSYGYSSNHQIKGNVKRPLRKIEDTLSATARGIVLDVPKRIVRSSVSKDSSGRYICFMLVHYPDTIIAEMRRLSLGAKVVASFVRFESGIAVIQVIESNGVQVTLTSADVHISKNNRFAKKISYFIMKVPGGSSERYSVGLSPVFICRGSKSIRLNLSDDKGLSDYLLGADIKRTVVLSGNDEIGRKVSVRVVF